MRLIKFPRRLYTSSSFADSRVSYLNKLIDSFLSTDALDSRTLLSAHGYIVATGNAHNRFITSKLIASYASLNDPRSSTKIFDSLSFKDRFLWNSIIKAHFDNGNYVQAIEFFSDMRGCGTLPNQFTIPMIVSTCAELGLLQEGMNIHGLVLKLNLFCGNSAVGASLEYMYAKCGALEDASLVFDEIAVRDVVAWTVLVIGYVQAGESFRGLECLCEMHRSSGEGERPNSRTLEGGFQACGDLSAFNEGRCLHSFAVKSGAVSHPSVQSAILSMYSKCQSIEDARVSFHEVVNKDLFSWTSVIVPYVRLGRVHEFFQIFLRMLSSGLYPDGMLLSCMFSGFANSMKVLEGKAFHGFILRRKYKVDPIVYNSLLSMYCKFGLMPLAERTFLGSHNRERDSWNLMIVGYEKAGLSMKCIELFREMQHEGIESDLNCFISVISSCSKLGVVNFGRSVHCHVIKNTVVENPSVVNSLITMYGRCGNLTAAQVLFHQAADNITTWNSLISSYTSNGCFLDALALFDEMISKDLKPNTTTLVILLSACAQSASLEQGRKLHDYVKEVGFEHEVSLDTALVDMYAKCGEVDMAREIFDSITEKDVVSWTVMISCYGMHGDGESAIKIFRNMEKSGVRPSDLTFLAVLSACARSGLIDEAKYLFDKMKDYSLIPTLKHYACMVELYGKLGCLHEAESLILSMPFAPDGGIWGSLLTACKMHHNVEMGMRIGKRAIEADPENDGYYVLLSDFYSTMEMWEGVEQVRKIMKNRGVRKAVGWSLV